MKTKDILADFEFQEIVNILIKRKLVPEEEIVFDESYKYDYIGLIVYDQKIGEHTKSYLQALSWDEKQVLMYILSEGGVIEEGFLLKAYFEDDRGRFEKVVNDLLSWGLIYYDPYYMKNFNLKLYGIPETYHDYVRVPIYLEGKLGYYLNRYSNSILLALENTISSEEITCQFRDYIIYKLKKELLTPDKIDENLKKLPLLKRKAVNVVTQNGGRMWFSEILKRMGLNKRPESAVRNIIWNNPFLFIIVDKKKDFLIQIPIDIYYLLKNKDDFQYFTFQQSLKVFINDGVFRPNEKISNYLYWYEDLIYIINTIQNRDTGSILYRGFSKKKHFFIKSQEYKGVPYIVYWLVLLGISNYIEIDGETFTIKEAFFKDATCLERIIRKMFVKWMNTYLSLEVFDKKYLRLKKLEETGKVDALHLKPIKSNLIQLFSDLEPEQPIRVDSFLKLFFDYYKIDTYYHTFDYDHGNFLNLSVEQLDLINNILCGPLYWLGAVEIYNREKIDFFFEQIKKQVSAKLSLNHLIKTNQVRKIDGYFLITEWGKNLFQGMIKKDDYVKVSRSPKITINKKEHVLNINSDFPFKKLVKILELGFITDMNKNHICSKIDGERVKKSSLDIEKEYGKYCRNGEELTLLMRDNKDSVDHIVFMENYKGIWFFPKGPDSALVEKIEEKEGIVHRMNDGVIVAFKKKDSVEWAKKNINLKGYKVERI